MAAYSLNLTFLQPGSWYVPTQDLVNIYHYAPKWVNMTVNASAIDDCLLLFKVATWAMKDVGALAFPEEVQAAPFLPEYYMNYYIGGIDDNAVWSSFMWNRMLSWARHGPPNGTLPEAARTKEEVSWSERRRLAQEKSKLPALTLAHPASRHCALDGVARLDSPVPPRDFGAGRRPAIVTRRAREPRVTGSAACARPRAPRRL